MTFERILVPLDGSALAEASLPAAEALGACLGSVLVLAHAVEPHPPPEVHGEPHLTTLEGAHAYLEEQSAHLVERGLSVEIEVELARDGGVAGAIDELAQRYRTDTVLMCAHGRQTLQGRLLGPIAERALRSGHTPILLRTAGARADEPFTLGRILMPIDFRHDLDRPREAMAALARGFSAQVTLLSVAERTSSLQARLLPGASSALLGFDRRRTQRRLSELADEWRSDGLELDSVVRDGPPDETILAEARRCEAEIVILSTHARSGVVAWYERSVAHHLVQARGLTLVLLREPPVGEADPSPV